MNASQAFYRAKASASADGPDRLVHQNMRLVDWCFRAIASRYPRIDSDDLYQQGMLGLVHAARRYVGERATFATYATHCIRGYMLKLVSGKSGWRRGPVVFTDNDGLLEENAVSPTEAEDLDFDHPEILEDAVKSLSDVRGGRKSIRGEVLRRRFGFGCKAESRRAIGKSMGVSHQRVVQIERSALSDIRWLINARKMREQNRAWKRRHERSHVHV